MSGHTKGVAEYDLIGTSYAATRQADPRVAAQINAALPGAGSVVNVGAGTGSYEPTERQVFAVEPSQVMLTQRPTGSAPAVQGIAEELPFADSSFDAAMAILTLHHWKDPRRGIAELRRVARRRVVVLTWDQDVWESFWLIRDYFPAIGELDRRRALPIGGLAALLGGATVRVVPIPYDCVDGFDGAFWRRPAAYLNPTVRSGISSFALLGDEALQQGLRRLAEDVESGAWAERFGYLLGLEQLDLGYRLLVAEL